MVFAILPVLLLLWYTGSGLFAKEESPTFGSADMSYDGFKYLQARELVAVNSEDDSLLSVVTYDIKAEEVYYNLYDVTLDTT